MKTWGVLAILSLLVVACSGSTDDHPVLGDIHTHQDFKVFILGEEINFAQEKYMSKLGIDQLSPFVHLHDMEGDIIHVHISGVTLGEFFRTIGMGLNDGCFVLDNGTSYCTDEKHKLTVLVNGEEIDNPESYQPQDLERILISYGATDDVELMKQFEQVTDKACIQSEKCPERGSPSDESTCLTTQECLAITGDVNIAPKEDDHVHDDSHPHE